MWSAVGFPVTSQNARDNFYLYSNWIYQAGVFVSRSSGTVYRPTLQVLWAMPALQVVLLLFFLLNAYLLWWDDWGLLCLCFVVGLLGGCVYVNGFSLISEKVQPRVREFSLSAASIADSCGILMSTLVSIWVQKSIYKYHNISDDDGR